MTTVAASDAPDYRRILFTGGGGFVGGYLAPVVAAAYPHAERLLLRRPGEKSVRENWETADADINDAAAIDALIGRFKPDLVLHLAAQASVGAGLQAGESTWRVNFDGTLELASACARRARETTFFFVSSSEVYGWSFRDGPAPEEAPLRPMSAYARSKAAAEAMLPDILPDSARLTIVRPFNHTGPGQDQRFVLPTLAAQVAAIEAGRAPPQVHVGNLSAERDFLDVRDVCAAYMALLAAGPRLSSGAVFNIASGARYRIGDLVEMFRRRSCVPFDIVVDQARLRPSDIPLAVGASEKLTRATGWKPQFTIEQVIDSLLDYWRANPNSRKL